MTPREVALDALVRVEEGAFANVLLPTLLRSSGMEQRERAQTTELVYGTLRRRRSLDALLEPVLDRDLDDVDPPVRAALRLGVYQLVEGVAPHAAVGETVGALEHVAPRAKGYANAVLRKVAALGPPWPWPDGDSVTAVGVRTSMPDWIVARLFDDLGVDDAAGRARDRQRTRVADPAGEPPPRDGRRGRGRARGRGRRGRARRAAPGRAGRARWRRSGSDADRARGSGHAAGPGQPGDRARASMRVRATGCSRSARHRAARPPRSRRRWTTRASWSRSTSTPARLGARAQGVDTARAGRSRRRRRRRARPCRSRRSPSIGSCSTRRAPVSACCAAGPRPAGASSPTRSTSSRRCSGSCSRARPRWCGRVGVSSTRCAR